jgi:hypothetical protein
VRAEADIDELDSARVPGPRVDQQPGLERAEGHGDVGFHGRAVHRPGVRVDAARQVDGDHGGAGLAGLLGPGGQGGERLAQPAAAADAEQPVDDQVGVVDGAGGVGHPAPGGAQRGQAARVRFRSGHDGGDGRAPAGQPGTRVEGVAGVVPASREHGHPGAVHEARIGAQQGGADRGQAGRG